MQRYHANDFVRGHRKPQYAVAVVTPTAAWSQCHRSDPTHGDLVENILLFSHIDADRTKLERFGARAHRVVRDERPGVEPFDRRRTVHDRAGQQ